MVITRRSLVFSATLSVSFSVLLWKSPLWLENQGVSALDVGPPGESQGDGLLQRWRGQALPGPPDHLSGAGCGASAPTRV